ncbi:WavE lipopolysaccharide synthesis family protein [Yersinia enterocolitica]|uniref:WavE lipopolysaccharide synthesis family protein n=1 Tax=Yersinia enterocolitica TaxID=630 RepID=UPI0005E67190|nr:WavE lipopolysaccharide synthesis family protein [Yersinia enterocolitica]ELI8168989.1 hypothetical protein [Yersinia enterocolitica]CFB68636.1 WavE lipopolysaccharide synthesis [Yersinia enterocolitica]HDL6594647.1 hypothetical protein [Yersinia enterocolitica]HDL8125078.1 hypothetical protein [Yersinia enterocolitica]HDL8518429.1 hypothetical protein [Yersinia enterocolitica]
MNKLSVVFSGPAYNEYSMDYAINHTVKIFKNCEVIISTNDVKLISQVEKNPLVHKIIYSENIGELPSLKFLNSDDKFTNNNINKQIECCLKGIAAASSDLVLRLRTDQVLLDDGILNLWRMSEKLPTQNDKKGRIITSSIFSINPRYSERMPYHISDMLQFGYKQDLISYFSAPAYPFEYATWYERNKHKESSNKFERTFRSKYAVEQWLALHYMFEKEENFPISFHNDCNDKIIENFEREFVDYFIIAHPSDIQLRASKFASSESYYNSQCYSTHECLAILEKKHPDSDKLSQYYSAKGIDKKYLPILMPIIYFPLTQFIIKKLNGKQKNKIKNIFSILSK